MSFHRSPPSSPKGQSYSRPYTVSWAKAPPPTDRLITSSTNGNNEFGLAEAALSIMQKPTVAEVGDKNTVATISYNTNRSSSNGGMNNGSMNCDAELQAQQQAKPGTDDLERINNGGFSMTIRDDDHSDSGIEHVAVSSIFGVYLIFIHEIHPPFRMSLWTFQKYLECLAMERMHRMMKMWRRALQE